MAPLRRGPSTTLLTSCIAAARLTSCPRRFDYTGGARDQGTACGHSRRDRGPRAPLCRMRSPQRAQYSRPASTLALSIRRRIRWTGPYPRASLDFVFDFSRLAMSRSIRRDRSKSGGNTSTEGGAAHLLSKNAIGTDSPCSSCLVALLEVRAQRTTNLCGQAPVRLPSHALQVLVLHGRDLCAHDHPLHHAWSLHNESL